MNTLKISHSKETTVITVNRIIVSFESGTLTVYFDTDEHARHAEVLLKKMDIKTTHFDSYLLIKTPYNSQIEIID